MRRTALTRSFPCVAFGLNIMPPQRPAVNRREPGKCPNLARNAGFQPAMQPPRWRRHGQIRTPPNLALKSVGLRSMLTDGR